MEHLYNLVVEVKWRMVCVRQTQIQREAEQRAEGAQQLGSGRVSLAQLYYVSLWTISTFRSEAATICSSSNDAIKSVTKGL